MTFKSAEYFGPLTGSSWQQEVRRMVWFILTCDTWWDLRSSKHSSIHSSSPCLGGPTLGYNTKWSRKHWQRINDSLDENKDQSIRMNLYRMNAQLENLLLSLACPGELIKINVVLITRCCTCIHLDAVYRNLHAWQSMVCFLLYATFSLHAGVRTS